MVQPAGNSVVLVKIRILGFKKHQPLLVAGQIVAGE